MFLYTGPGSLYLLHNVDAPEPKACAYISSGPIGPTLECNQEDLPQSLGNKSDASRAIPEGIGCIGASKSTPGRLQPTRKCHTTPPTPPKPPTSFKTLNIAPFGLASHQDLASTPSNIPNQSHCDPNVFPTFPTSADPQQSDACRSRAGRSEIGAQQKGDTQCDSF